MPHDYRGVGPLTQFDSGIVMMTSDIRKQDFDHYLRQQVKESIPIFSGAALASFLTILVMLKLFGTPDTQTVQVLTVFILLSVVFLKVPLCCKLAHGYILLTGLGALTLVAGVAPPESTLLYHSVVLTTLITGAFLLDVYWLTAANIAALTFWFQYQEKQAEDLTQPMGLSTLVIAIGVAQFLAYLRRRAQWKRFQRLQRLCTLSEKLEGISAEADLSKQELQSRIERLENELHSLEEQRVSYSHTLQKLGLECQATLAKDSIGRLAGGVAHDFNNLLTAFFFNFDDLIHGSDDSNFKDDMRASKQAAERVAQLTQQLLALNRRQVLQRQLVNPRQQLEKLRQTLAKLFGEEVFIDPDLIDRVLLNLLGTKQAEDSGSNEVLIRLWTQSNELIYTIVHDNWEAPEDRLGLSLAAVEGVVEQHGGTFKARSESGKTRFRVSLPLVSPEDSAALTRAIPRVKLSEGPILVLEEDPQVLRLIRRSLNKRGWETCGYRTTEELMEKLPSFSSASVLICDYYHTQGKSRSLIDATRRSFPNIKVILMSAPSGTTTLDLAPDISYLPKPFSLEKLGETVENVAF